MTPSSLLQVHGRFRRSCYSLHHLPWSAGRILQIYTVSYLKRQSSIVKFFFWLVGNISWFGYPCHGCDNGGLCRQIYPNVLIHLAAQLKASVSELVLEVTEPIPLPNGCYICRRNPKLPSSDGQVPCTARGFFLNPLKKTWILSTSNFEFRIWPHTSYIKHVRTRKSSYFRNVQCWTCGVLKPWLKVGILKLHPIDFYPNPFSLDQARCVFPNIWI